MKYSLDIIEREKTFANIEIDKGRVLIGAYEDGKITRKLFNMDEEQLELLIKGLQSALILMREYED